uniref:MFS domain-containing protein n=1 Tax=Caenorhabditis japonica TaxID=281687 RepID=A0A8R1I997_CAEJA
MSSDPALLSWNGVRLFLICSLLTAMTNFPSGFSHTSVNTAVHKLNEYLNSSFTERYRPLDHEEVSLLKSGINSAWYLFQVLGAMCSPFLCDNYGRKVAFALSIAFMTIAGAMQMLASFTPYSEVLIAGRLIAAVFSPLSDAALILYLQEISPASLRGTMSSLYSTGYSTMCLLGMLLGHESLLGHSLSVLLFVPVIPGILSTAFILWMPDTPKFLLLIKKDKIAALKSLRFFQGSLPDQVLLIDSMEQHQKDIINEEEEDGTSVMHIVTTPHLRKAMLLSVAAAILTLPFYPILQSSTFFFTDMGVDMKTSQMASSLMMVVLTASSICSTLIIDKVPRRILLLTCGSCTVLFLSIFAIAEQMHQQVIAMGACFGFVMTYGIGVGPVIWSIPPELSPQANRSMMFCLVYSIHSILVVITNFSTIPLFMSIGAFSFVFLFAIPSAFALVYLLICLPETSGREIHVILNELKGIVDEKEPNTDIITSIA